MPSALARVAAAVPMRPRPMMRECAAAQAIERGDVVIPPVGVGRPQEVVVKVDAARQGEHQADRRVGDFFGAVIGHVGDRNAAGAGEGVIDVVVAHAAADDELAVLQPLDRGLASP